MGNIFKMNGVEDDCGSRTPVKMRAYFYLSTKNQNKKGLCPIVCRVSAIAERKDFRTGIFLEPEQWDYRRSWPVDNTQQVEHRLTKIRERVYKIIAAVEDENVCSPAIVVERYLENRNKKVLNLTEIAQQYLEVVKPTPLVKSRILRDSKLFVKKTGVALVTSVMTEHIQGFVAELTDKGYSMHTILKKLQNLRRVFDFAHHKNYLRTNLFDLYSAPRAPRVQLVHLTPEEIKTIMQHKFAAKRLNYIRDLFIFQCYTGLSYSDLWLFRKELETDGSGIVDTGKIKFLKGWRAKTGEEFIVPWLPEAAAIAARYDYNFRKICNQKFNSYLKELSEILAIEKRLTSHVGRKTFAQEMINRGYSAEAVSKMMGHASFSMTQKHYGRIGEKRIEIEVMRLAS